MKLIQVTLALALLVASTYALKCNVGGTDPDGKTQCDSTDFGVLADTCFSCKVTSGGKSGTVAAGCKAGAGLTGCDALKASCSDSYKSCTTDNCNSCSPASALHASAVLLLAVAAAMML
jgi:hypothetical protein